MCACRAIAKRRWIHLRFVFCFGSIRVHSRLPLREIFFVFFRSKLHPHRPQDLERHLWVNLIRTVVGADYGPVLLVGKIQHINPQLDVVPSIKDTCMEGELSRYYHRPAVSEVDRARDLSPEAEP